ncbi:MAG: hypothetical protein JXA62_04055 [Candidatus Aminicenantes bacterium]|nr:hypothetical protein [Candidatus Aminicenantes bacterium]
MIQPASVKRTEESVYRDNGRDETENSDALRCRISAARNELVHSYILMNAREQEISLKAFMGEVEKQLIEYALLVCFGNQSRASRLLGTKPTCLCEKIKRYGIRKLDPNQDMPVTRLKEMLRILAD